VKAYPLEKISLKRALNSCHMTTSNISKNKELLDVAKDMSFQTLEDLFANIGYGKIPASQVVTRLKEKLGIEKEADVGLVRRLFQR
jgi:GTP pyrophosphokinase